VGVRALSNGLLAYYVGGRIESCSEEGAPLDAGTTEGICGWLCAGIAAPRQPGRADARARDRSRMVTGAREDKVWRKIESTFAGLVNITSRT